MLQTAAGSSEILLMKPILQPYKPKIIANIKIFC